MKISQDDIQAVQALYDQGLMLEAYRYAQAIAPLRQWRGPGARVLAGRLASNIGAPNAGRTFHRLAYREDPTDPEAIYYNARAILESRGLLAAWEFMQARQPAPDAPDYVLADWYSFAATVAAYLRDFETADLHFEKAQSISSDRPWLHIERCHVLELQDRYIEALASAKRSLEIHPWFRSGILAAAHVMQLLQRDSDALELLTEGAKRLESAWIAGELASLQLEMGLFKEARESVERLVELCPMLDRRSVSWLYARRADAAYYCGDYSKAIEFGRLATSSKFHQQMADKLEQSAGVGNRVILPVKFVRQHYQTCAPATLSALSQFWNRPVEHLTIAEQICYDGTPPHSSRRWAEDGGWFTREFTVTWEAAVALIDRGVPFALSTSSATSGHLQSVIGYDSIRGTLLIRDPFQRVFSEFIAEPFFESQRWSGPQGLVFVPKEDASVLDGITLPDAIDYDDIYKICVALEEHRRNDAEAVLRSLRERGSNERLTQYGRRSLADYDGNLAECLAATEKLLEIFPEPLGLHLSRLAYLRTVGTRQDRLDALEKLSLLKGAGPLAWSQHAQELQSDAREQFRALRLLRKSIRFMPQDAVNFYFLAGVRWEQRQFALATQLYRFAMTLNDKNEQFARSFFIASRHVKQSEAVLEFMRRRVTRAADRSSQPTRTLAWAYQELGRSEEAFGVLEKAIAQMPDDGDLRLHLANVYARYGFFQKAEELMNNSAAQVSHSTSWFRNSAIIADLQGDRPKALEMWRRVTELEPMSDDAHAQYANLLSDTSGKAEAIRHLRAAADRFPHNLPLHRLLASWLRDEAVEGVEPIVRKMLESHPNDGWSRRELVLTLLRKNDIEQADAEVDILLTTLPNDPKTHDLRGRVLLRQKNLDAARTAFREAITLAVDADFAISSLMSACDTPQQRREALQFIEKELVRQTIFGDGLLAFRAHARNVLEPENLLALLRDGLAARKDLWHAWSAVVRQLTDMNRLDEAESLARQAVDRFPLLPRLWNDLANIYRVKNDAQNEKAALQKAIELSPNWSAVIRQLAEVHIRQAELEPARVLLERAVAREPQDPLNHGCLADVLWKQGNREAAVEHAKTAARIEPDYNWAWNALCRWSDVLKCPQLPVDLARDLTARGAGRARSWLVLARILTKPDDLAERLAALDKAVELDPRDVEAWDLKAILLSEAGRPDDAIAAAKPASFGENPPSRLRARSAWISAQRGNIPHAINQIRQVLLDDPALYWGWQLLAEWSEKAKDSKSALDAVKTMSQRWPHDSEAACRLGDALVKTEDRVGAMSAYARAAALDPEHEYPVGKRFDMLLGDNQLAEAAKLLFTLETRFPSSRNGARADRLASSHLAKWQKNPPLPTLPSVAEKMAQRLVEQNKFKEARRLIEQLWSQPELGIPATKAFLYALVDKKNVNRAKWYIFRNRARLRQHTQLWGSVGFLYSKLVDHRRSARWHADWPSRPDVQSWMLVNCSLALRRLRKPKAARIVNQRGLELAPNKGREWEIHALYLSADELLDGDYDRAASYLLADSHFTTTDRQHRFVRSMVRTALAIHQAPSPREAMLQAKLDFAKAIAEYPTKRDRMMRRFTRRCLLSLFRQPIGLQNRLWCVLKMPWDP